MERNQLVRPKRVLKYIFLPEILPRVKQFSRDGFGWLAHLMAVIFHMVRLLPAGHAYLNPANIGRFGLKHVLTEAYCRLSFKKENIDQVIIFFALCSGLVILMAQFILIFINLIVRPAMAAMPNFFGTANPDNDIAFMLLDSVFGIPGLFESCVATATTCGTTFPNLPFPSPFHLALHDLFNFYNLAILIIAVLIFAYYVVIIIGETAASGTPFGRRFAHVWAPIRLVVALGLLVPLNYGLNSAQYITLFAAKMGSGFATNGWLTYNSSLTNSLGRADESLIANPKPPDLTELISFMMLAKACEYGYETSFDIWSSTQSADLDIKPYLVRNPDISDLVYNNSWNDARNFYEQDSIRIVFGHDGKADDQYPTQVGGVYPFCGELILPVQDFNMPGARDMQEAYYNYIIQLWNDPDVHAFGLRAACIHGPWEDGGQAWWELPYILVVGAGEPPVYPYPGGGPYGYCVDTWNNAVFGASDNPSQLPPNGWLQEFIVNQEVAVKADIATATGIMESGLTYSLSSDVAERGWAGAAIWYNNIARWNGAMFSAVHTLPKISQFPDIMTQVRLENLSHNENLTLNEQYNPGNLKQGQGVNYRIAEEAWVAQMLGDVYKYFNKQAELSVMETSSGNIFEDAIASLFSLDAIFDIRENDNVNPLAQLAGMGKSIVDVTIVGLLATLAGSGLSGLFTGFEGTAQGSDWGQIFAGVQGISMGIASFGLTIGFILYYVLPFLPFIYFFFAVGSWLKGIFEAMVGVPLWALAHLRIDGNGLPGQTAMNGYFLIFDIFARPILTICGLIASLAIFSAMAQTLNGIFDFAVENVAGYTCDGGCNNTKTLIADLEFNRSYIDQFFFTIVYTILLYMIGTASFKLIDQIPDKILRWMGAGVPTFSDQDGDVIGSFTQYAAFGAGTMSQQAVGAMGQGAGTVGRGLGGIGKSLMNRLGGPTNVGGA